MKTIDVKNISQIVRNSVVWITAILFVSILKPTTVWAQTQNGTIEFSVYSSGYYTV